ncbi:uncharacterized protein PFL1_00697 [Pseudozyma flocculosa PF-1]|uniref:Uncharacterized protein n=1 Tax=Pseudozyma flocculosa TaxID=84751 RepID=A0A5C3F5B1_9BASI|nr:uncharacterized protein PFL1_00697 [Pseudozyma flocculosa PF-1]EPQ31362.1 hypothetical protein PFL1_00697 [Pseudozyma flocculosa PF-1]SPO38857.1 uncharacterized protein PSFLO_04336 [Pseudozyma flocculosa]
MGLFEKSSKRANSDDSDPDLDGDDRAKPLKESEDGYLDLDFGTAAPPPPSYGDALASSSQAASVRVKLSDLVTPTEARRRPNLLSQYVVQRHKYAAKSRSAAAGDDANDSDDEEGGRGILGKGAGKLSALTGNVFKGKAKAKAETSSQAAAADSGKRGIQLIADTRRIYSPGDTVQATIRVPSDRVSEQPFDSLTCELKGDIRTYGIFYDGQGNQYISHATHPIFKHVESLLEDGIIHGAAQDGDGRDALGDDRKLAAPGATTSAAGRFGSLTSSSSRVQIVSPPDDDFVEWRFISTLPSTFVDKDHMTKPLPSTFHGRGDSSSSNWCLYCFKLVGRRRGVLKRAERVWLPILVVNRSVALPVPRLSLPTAPGQIPREWTVFRTGATQRKNLVQERAILLIDCILPPVDTVACNGEIPVAIRATAISKDSSCIDPRLGSSGDSVLPDLRQAVRLALRRTDESSAKGASHTDTAEYGVTVRWSEATVPWTLPEPFDPERCFSGAAGQDDDGGQGSASGAAPRPIATSSQTRRFFPKSVPKLPPAGAGYLVSTSTLHGAVRLDVSPGVRLAHLQVGYELLLRCRLEWKHIKENLRPLDVRSPISDAETGAGALEVAVAVLGEEGAQKLLRM